MATSYETMELIASHHAELERLCTDLLEQGSRLGPEDPGTAAFRERVRALGWRLRAHRAEEAAALLADAGEARARVAELMRREVAEVEAILERADEVEAPLELARTVCDAARTCRAQLDRLVRSA